MHYLRKKGMIVKRLTGLETGGTLTFKSTQTLAGRVQLVKMCKRKSPTCGIRERCIDECLKPQLKEMIAYGDWYLVHHMEIEVHQTIGLGPSMGLATGLSPSIFFGFLNNWALKAC